MRKIIILLVAVIALPMLFSGISSASRTLYFVDSSVNILCSNSWVDTDCWSLSSGGAGGQSVPTSTDNVIFDGAGTSDGPTISIVGGQNAVANNINFAIDAGEFTEIRVYCIGGVGPGGTLTFNNMISLVNTDVYVDTSNPGICSPEPLITFSGTINGNVNNPDTCNAYTNLALTLGGQFTKSGPITTSIQKASLCQFVAIGNTIYCSPGCENGFSNTNVVLGPFVPNPACNVNLLIPGILLIILAFVGIAIVVFVTNELLSDKKNMNRIFAMIITLVIVIAIASVFAFNIKGC